jgi:formamidopyrimidine-DNA glycosylase
MFTISARAIGGARCATIPHVPELPDITVYVESIAARVGDCTLAATRLGGPFVLRTVDPPVAELAGRAVVGVERLGKRVVLALEGDRFVVVHLMIAGRFRWTAFGAKIPGKLGVAAWDFADAKGAGVGALVLTEASTQKRAAVHLVRGREALRAFDRGGLDVMSATPTMFAATLRRERHTLKRTLTDPTLIDGIGNAYSDEILHHARMSPVTMSDRLDDDACARLLASCRAVLTVWTDRLREEARRHGGWPDHVTAFHEAMTVHGKHGKPCVECATTIQRIVHGAHETNYCPRCQTGGKLLADRALSRLLKGDWPKTIEELEERKKM